ncbi:unnamed protein product [Knipowitschia caucasica]
MAKVEKHRSSRKSGHRKRNDGGYSDTETDREVSSLTDRAFRSLCIGDEAVYNDSDLCASPCTKRDTDILKRTAHESFSLRVQQYGQDWMYGGMYGAEIHKDQQWGMYGESGAQERLSSSYQSSVEAHQQETPSRELSLFSNGTTEVSSQQRRSNSRVSSLVRAFNSEGQGDEATYNDETSWDKSALMSIERELSEFSPYPQNMNTGYFPSTGLFSSQNTNYYSSEVAAQMNSASTFMRSSHSISTEVNSNFFIHSEFSPFKVWRDQNRFPFHRGQVSGFMPRSEFQKWYETPMYKELSLQPQQHPSMFSQGYQKNTFATAIPMNPQRSTSASTMMQRASAVERRCELELAGQYRKRAQSTGVNRLPPQRPSTASPASDMSRRVRDTISSVKSLQQKIKMMAEQNLETQNQEGFSNNNYTNSYDPNVNNMVSSIPYAAPYQMQKPLIYQPSEQQQLLQQHSVSPQPVEHAPVRAESRGATPDIKMSSYKSRAASLLYNLKDNRKRVKATYSPNAYQGLETQEIYKQEPKDCVINVPEISELSNSTDDRVNRLAVPEYGYQPHHPGMHTQSSQKSFENAVNMSKFNVTQYGYQVCSSGSQHNSQHLQYSQSEFGNSVEKSMLHVPQYGYYKPHSPGMLQNSQYKLGIPMEGGISLDVGQYGYQAHSPGMQQNMQFPQFTQNMQNIQQHYLGQSSSEYYRAQMQGEMAPHHGFSGYTPEYYTNTQLANGQNPYGNISSFTPYKQSLSDKGEGSYANWLEQNTEVQRFGPVVQRRDYVSKDNSRQQFNEAASGEYTGVDRYNQVKENKYDYNNVNSQDMWGQTNSRQIQKPAIPSAQNYQNINAYPRNSQENMLNYQYEQKAMDNYATRPQGTFNGSNQMLQHAPPHPANTGNAGYNTQPQPGTYRDIYAPPMSHKINKEINMKENYAPQDNHKYYDQELSKKQTIISSQVEMLIATEELVQRKQEGKIKEKLKDISTGDMATNEQVSFQQNKTEDPFAEDRKLQDKDRPTAEDLIKQMRRENSPILNDVEVEKVTDKQEHMTYIEPQRREPETQQLIVEAANTEELKEEPIKCELATSSEEARIEQVKPEPSHEVRVITEEATEPQVGEENVAIEEDRKEATELLMECHGNKKHVEYKDIDISVEEQKIPQNKNEKEADVTVNAAQTPKEDTTNTNYVESLFNSNKPEASEPDKVKLAKTKAESSLKEMIIDGPAVKKGEEHTEQENYNVSLQSREPQFLKQNEDFTDRGEYDFENIKDKNDYSQNTSRNDTSTTSTAHKQETTAGKNDQIKENKEDTNLDKQNIREVLSKTTEDCEKVGNPHDDPAGSQYVYSETSKDFKLSVSGVPDTKDICEKVTIKDVPIENVNNFDASLKNDYAKQQHDKSEMSERNVPNLTDTRTLQKYDACLQENLTVVKLDKPSISKQKEVAKQLHMERKTKSIDQKAGTSKETVKGLIQREKAQTKQEMLTSKIKAHAEKEISAIKEGFAVKDGLKNPSKALAIGQNVTIRQKPPSQEVLKKQDRPMINNISKESQSQTVVSATGTLPPENENASLKVSTSTNMETTESKTTSLKMTTNDTVNNDKKCNYPTDGKRVKSQPDDKSLKQDSLSKGYEVDQASHENKTPLQLQNDISAQDKSLEMMNIMVTVREQKPEKVENQGQAEVLRAEDHHVVETTIKSPDKVGDSQDSNKTTHDTRDDYSVTTKESAVKNVTDKTSEECPQQECSLPNERPQSEILLSDHLVVPRTVTVPAKNNLLAETQYPTNKHNTISVETKVYANKPPNVALESTLIKGQEEPTREINLKSVSATSNEDSQEDNLHIDRIAIQVVPVLTEEGNKAQQRTVSNTLATEDETQKSVPSNDDVQKVISSVRKQAQLLKNSKQSKLDNTPTTSNESDNHRNVDETETLSNYVYFQVDRETVPQKCTNVEQSSENVSQESKPSSTSTKDEIIKMSKEKGNTQIDTKIKDEKVVVGNTRRHHMAKGRQRGVLTPHQRPDNNVEVKPKPKVPIPEISALADYARLKVIVSKDDEDSIQEQPPHKKEGFFPLIQSHHSRRPVFTVDSQEDVVKGKGSQDLSEAQVKVSKEPPTVVIPITEKQPQRADMFKLGAKENPEVQKREPTDLMNTNTEDRIKDMLEKSRAKQAEEDKRAAQREEERRASEREAIAAQIRERRKKQREAERYAEEEGRGKIVEQQMGKPDEPSLQQQKVMSTEDKQKLFETDKTAERKPDENIRAIQKQNSDAHKAEGKSHVLEEELRKDYLEEPNKNTTHIEEQKSRKILEEDQRKIEEQKKKDILEEQQRRVQMEEQKKRFVVEEQNKGAALKEQEKQAAKTEEQKRIVVKEGLRKVPLEENTRKTYEEQQKQAKAAEAQTEQQKRRAAPEKKMSDETTEQQRQATLVMEQKKRVSTMAHDEKQKPATLEEQQRRAAEKEELRKIAEKEQYRQSAILEEQKKRAAVEEQQKKVVHEEKQRQAALKEKEQRAALEEQQRRVTEKEKQRRMGAEELQRRAASEEKLRRDALIEEQKRKAVAEEQQRRAAREEQLRKAAAEEEQKRKAAAEEEQKRKAAAEEEQKRKAAAEEEQKRKAAAEEEQKRKAAAEEEQKRKAAAEEEQKRKDAVEEEQKRKAAVEEEQKRKAAVEEEQKRKAAVEEEQKRKAAVEEEQKRKAAVEEEQKRKAAVEEEQKRKTAVEEEQKRKAAAEEEQKRKAAVEEEQKRKAAVEEEQKRKTAVEEEQKRKAAVEEEQKRKAAVEEEQKRKAAVEEEQKRKAAQQKAEQEKAALEEQKRRAAHGEQLRKAEEQKRRAAAEEEKKRRAEEEQKRRVAVEEEQKRRAQIEEQKRKAVEEEQRKTAEIEENKRQAAHKERLRKMAEEEQLQKAEQEKAALEEQQRRAAEEKQRKMAEEEQQRRAAVEEEQKRKAAAEEQLRKNKIAEEEERRRQAAHEEQLRKAEEQKRRAAVEEEQKRRAAEEVQKKRKAAEEEKKRRAALEEEQKRRAALEEEKKRRAAVEEEQKRRAALEEEQKRRAAPEEEQKRRAAPEEEQKRRAALEEEKKRRAAEEVQKKRKAAEEEKKRRAALEEEQKRRAALEEEKKRRAAVEEEQKRRAAEEEEQKRKAQIEEQKRKAAEEEKKKTAEMEKIRKQAAHKERLRKMTEEEQLQKAEQEKAALKEHQTSSHEEQLRKAAVIEEQRQIAAEEEARRKDVQVKKQRRTRQEEEETRLAYIREERIKRQIEEEKEAKIEEERSRRQQSSEENLTYKGKAQPWSQKDIRTRPVVNQEGTDEAEREKYTSETTEALQYYSLTSEKVSPPQKRSNTNESETVKDTKRPHSLVSPVPTLPRSSATSPAFGMKPSMFKVKDNTSRGTSLTKSIKPRFHKNFGEEYRVGSPMDRGWERNESDLPQHRPFSRRSLALDEEDSRSIISNMSEDVDSVATSATDLADIRALYDSDRPESACSYSSDVSRSFGKPPAVPPKSEKGLRRAKRLATRRQKKELYKDVMDDSCEAAMSEDTSKDVVASPHFTRPISIARVPPAGSNLSLSHSDQSQKRIHTAPHVSPHTPTPQVTSSPAHHHVPKPVTQYQVESGFSQTYTQKRVMQDVGSGQYYVVDVPVEVKTKTFFDPETGKYVQLNVRESNRNAAQRQPLQGYPQGHLKPKLQAKPQPIPSNNAQYQSYPSIHKGYQSATTSSGPVNQSMTPATRDQRMTGNSYNSDKTPYMDTVNNVDKPHHGIYNTQGSQGAISEGDDQLVNSRYAKRNIITMSELEDFMEVSDW